MQPAELIRRISVAETRARVSVPYEFVLARTEHRMAVLVPCDDSVRVMRCYRLAEWSRRGATGCTTSPTTAALTRAIPRVPATPHGASRWILLSFFPFATSTFLVARYLSPIFGQVHHPL